MVFRIHYQPQGGHVHCSLYVAQAPDRTFALAGTFMLRQPELEALEAQCPKIQFVARSRRGGPAAVTGRA